MTSRSHFALAAVGLTLALFLPQQLLIAEDEPETREEKINGYVQRLADTERKGKMTKMVSLIDDIDRVCELEENQRAKLDLAAKGAVDKYLESWREEMDNWVRNRVRNSKGDIDQFLTGMGTVRFGQARDWAPEGQALWVKSVSDSLSDDQRAAYKADLDARVAFKHQTMAQTILVDLDQRVKFTTDQREQLLPLIKAATEKYWDKLEQWTNSDENLPLFQMGAILGGVDDDKVAEILSEDQVKGWKAYFSKHSGGWNMIERMADNPKKGIQLQIQIRAQGG